MNGTPPALLLTINGGSSSIRFSVYEMGSFLQKQLSGKIDRIGLPGATLTWTVTPPAKTTSNLPVKATSMSEAAEFLLGWLKSQINFDQLQGVGHRIVYGRDHASAAVIDADLLDELHQTILYDPEHLPGEIELIKTIRNQHPRLTQVACFDTSFYVRLPRMAQLLAIPRRFEQTGMRRYGFHGLSYGSVLEQLEAMDNPQAVSGRCILAHLGNGASITALRDQQPMDTSMGFTPASGLPMGTRSGDLDPGVPWYLMRKEKVSLEQYNHLVNHESGLLGISEISSDMEDLLSKESTDERAAEAVAFFCYQVKKWIGSYSAVLGGLDLLAFTGGIGENAAPVRSRICAGLEYLGIDLDAARNQRGDRLISTETSRLPVYVIQTDEESMIAKNTAGLLHLSKNNR
jgi:acetate kinase